MKLSPSSIGALLFAAIGTTAFVFMAKRPAVDATAMQFGMTNSSAQATTPNAPDSKEPQQTSSDSIDNKANENVATENKAKTVESEKTTDVAPVPEKTETPVTEQVTSEATNKEQPSNTAFESIPAQETAPSAPAMPTMAPTTMPTPTKEAVIDNKEMSAESASVAPSFENTAPETAPITQAEETQAPTSTPQTAETLQTEIATPATTQVPATDTGSSNAISNALSDIKNATTTSMEPAPNVAPESTSAKPKTITVRTDKLFGDSLPADLTNQLPETIEIPVDMLFDRSAPTEATAE